MEPEGSLPCSRKPATGLCPNPDASSPYLAKLSKTQIHFPLPGPSKEPIQIWDPV